MRCFPLQSFAECTMAGSLFTGELELIGLQFIVKPPLLNANFGKAEQFFALISLIIRKVGVIPLL